MIHVSAKFKPVTNSLDMPFVDQDLVDRAVGITIFDLSDRCYNSPVSWLTQAFYP
jgi:hypothetical protein